MKKIFSVLTIRLVPTGIVSVIVSELASSVVDRGSEPRSGKTKEYKFGICCVSAEARGINSLSSLFDHYYCSLPFFKVQLYIVNPISKIN